MDLFRLIEKSLRSYPEQLPIDDFLPPPEDIPSALASEPATGEESPEHPKKTRRASPRSVPQGKKAGSSTPAGDPKRVSDHLDAEIREFLQQQKARGRHDPSEWVQEDSAGEKDPDGGGGGSRPGS